MEAPREGEKEKGPHKKEKIKNKKIPALSTPFPKLLKFDVLTSCKSSHNSPNAHYYYYYETNDSMSPYAHYYYYYVYKTSDSMPVDK